MTLRSLSISFNSSRFLHWAGAAALVAVVAAAPRAARAADDDTKPSAPADDDAEDDAQKASKPSEAKDPPPPAAPPTPVKEDEVEPKAVGLVERLPPSAYYSPVARGLHGGSLWLSSQGLQWPYLPRTTIGVSGYAWLDTNYRSLVDGQPSATYDRRDTTVQGRGVLRFTPTYSKGEWFAQVQAELVANKTQTTPAVNADVDDLWIRVGKWKSYDLTVGRFESFEVYHLGMGLDLNTDERKGAFSDSYSPPALYNASFMYYRPDEAGNVAVHLYPTDNLRLEVLGQVGNVGPFNSMGVRPAAIFDMGWLKLRAAYEYQVQTDPKIAKGGATGFQDKNVKRGGAGSAQIVIDPYVEFGVNAGYALVDVYDVLDQIKQEASTTTTSFGGFLNAQPFPDFLIGFGANKVHQSDQHIQNGRFGEYAHLQTFGALQYFWESTVLVKLVVGYAKGDSDATYVMTPAYSNKLVSARLRLQVLF